MIRFRNWWNGWRLDHEGWWVRALRRGDPLGLPAEIGFVEESCIVVRTPELAREVDTGAIYDRGGRLFPGAPMTQRRFILVARHIRDDQDNVINESTDAAGIAADVLTHLLDDPGCDYQFTVISDFRRIGSLVTTAAADATRELQFIRDAVKAYDDKLDDAANSGKDARPPNGDDYNEITYLVMNGGEPDPVRDAAHDMLAALRRAHTEILAYLTPDEVKKACPGMEVALDLIVAAIAKAEGRTDA